MRSGRTLLVLFLTACEVCYAQWQQVTQVPSREISSLNVINGVVYAGTDSLIYLSADGGMTWTRSGLLSGSVEYVQAVTHFNGRLFAGTLSHGVFTSSDGGAQWQQMNNGLTGLGATDISSFATQSGRLIVGTRGAGTFLLNHDMQGWTSFGNLPLSISGTVYAMTARGDTVTAGAGSNGYLYRLFPGSTQWIEKNFAGSMFVPAMAFARLDDDLFAGTTNGIYRSSDRGETWQFAGSGVQHGIELWLTADAKTLYAAVNKLGFALFYRSTNRGQSWTEELLYNGATFALLAHGNRIYAAREDGLWYQTISVTSVEDPAQTPSGFTLEQNYPNPFNPETVISFQLPVPGMISLKVFDRLGRVVAEPVLGTMIEGHHRVRWNAAGLPSGVYFYRLEAADVHQTKTMLLLK